MPPVNQTLPSVTVLIPARPEQADIKAVTGSRALDYPADKLEIIVARGRHPSVQRNAALKAARHDLIYFLDDDSVPQSGNLKLAAAHFADSKVEMVGGPNICPPDAPPLEQVFALVLGSWLGFFSSRARYLPLGQLRETSEKELILCNLLARRDALIELGGFDEKLYPNEENALMDELQKRGGKLLYDPRLVVHRRPRHSLKAFARMLMTYGRGRAEQFRVKPTVGSVPNFAPPFFCLYLLLLPFLYVWLSNPTVAALLILYGLAVLVQAAALVPRGGVLRSLGALPLIVLTHVLYGIGFWRGLFTSLKSPEERPPTDVRLETIRL